MRRWIPSPVMTRCRYRLSPELLTLGMMRGRGCSIRCPVSRRRNPGGMREAGRCPLRTLTAVLAKRFRSVMVGSAGVPMM